MLTQCCWSLAVLLLVGSPPLWVRTAGAQTSSRERHTLEAVRVDRAPRIDGVLDEDVWQGVPIVDQFTQQEPKEGAPASERTEVRVIYDRGHLFIGVRAFDSQPAGIIATDMRRDSDRLLDEDNFQVILDTFSDSRNGYMFVTTPLGAKLEQQISEEGEGNTRGNRNNSNINRNWDGVWDVAARRTDEGWTAEIGIPMTTVRFADREEQTWGINFMRNIRRKNEQVFWAPIPKAYSLTRVSLAGALTGLRSISHGMDLKLKPFMVAGVRKKQTSAAIGTTSALRDVGLDARYGVSGGLNLDVTVNTDFAQVEVDQQQINLTRFSLFFPEKRDFFLENAGLFNMGTGGTFTSGQLETDLFFTRRIGLSETGQPVPILGGARLAGKTGRHNIGLLDIQTGRAFGKPGDNFLVGRYSSDVLKRSRIGALFVNKESMHDAHYNRTFGADANLALGRSMQVSSFVAKTSTPGLDGKDLAWFGRVAYRDPKWNLWLNYEDVQDNFNAEVGFVQRRGIRATKAYFSPTPRPGKAGIRLMEPMVVLSYVTDQHNRLVSRTQHFMVGTWLDDGSFINVIHQRNLDVLDEPFQVQRNVRIPVGAYTFNEWTFTYNTNPARRVYQRFTFQPDQYYGGTSRTLSIAAGVRATSQFSSELQYSRNDVKLPYGNFVLDLAILRMDYTLSPRMTVRSLTQYNSSTREVTSSIRFNYIYRPGSDLYIVYNDLQQTGLLHGAFGPTDRQLVVKLNYLLAR
ncbi:MAG: carbohydrate binding family 9 domain-containing protein [Acidobacteria bacterium]|nr:carbohydrate binding family 9 domain-containing protein [Acidobacteriota bacterium]MBI3262123.1 carbohydrate binding family 9 domain-containing protein [Acidobacteriota bacterium]